MGLYWDERAREDAYYFVDNRLDYRMPDVDRFWAGGEEALGVLLDRQAVFDLLKKAMNDAAAANPNPQAAALMQQMQTPAGMMTLLLLASVMFLFMSLILCSVGGAAGAALMKQER